MKEQTLDDWLESLAAKQSTPGGGAAASLLMATAAALIEMVTIFTQGPRWIERQAKMQEVNEAAKQIRQQALELADEEAEAFSPVMSAYGLPKITEEEIAVRQQAVQQALIKAADVPAQIAKISQELLPTAKDLVDTCNPNLLSDVGVAAATAKAALESAIMNIEINTKLIYDHAVKDELQQTIEMAEQAITTADTVVEAVRKQLQ